MFALPESASVLYAPFLMTVAGLSKVGLFDLNGYSLPRTEFQPVDSWFELVVIVS